MAWRSGGITGESGLACQATSFRQLRAILAMIFMSDPQDIVSMPKFRPGRVLTELLLMVLLAGCGQKGPLYLPKPQPQPPSPEQPSTVKP